jgi:hypothetical protein
MSTSSIAAPSPATAPSSPTWIATSGSPKPAVNPASDVSAPGASRLPVVRKPATGPSSPSASWTAGTVSPSFHPSDRAPATSSASRRPSWARIPAAIFAGTFIRAISGGR